MLVDGNVIKDVAKASQHPREEILSFHEKPAMCLTIIMNK